MEQEILSFINKRWQGDADWMCGNCLWFALILKTRFSQGEIFYLPIDGHFIFCLEDKFYDWRGRISPEEVPVSFCQIQNEDPLLYNNLLRDCFY